MKKANDNKNNGNGKDIVLDVQNVKTVLSINFNTVPKKNKEII